MDEVTRPGRAAQVCFESVTGFGPDDGETSEASLPSSAQGSEEEPSEGEEEVDTVPETRRHPGATRHSTRAQANKRINYSRKHHPQDHSLPGHQYKARLLEQVDKKRRRRSEEVTSEGQESDKENDSEDNVQASGESEQLPEQPVEDEEEQSDEEATELARPRKKLRTLPDDRSSSPQKSSKKRRSAKSSSNNAGAQQSDTLQATDEEDDAGMITGGNPFSSADQQVSSSDDNEAALNLTGVVADAEVSSSLRAPTRQCGIGQNMFAGEDDEDPADVHDEAAERSNHSDEEPGSTTSNEDEGEAGDEEDDESSDKTPAEQGAEQNDVEEEDDDGFPMNDDGPESPFEPVISLQDIAKGPSAASNRHMAQETADFDTSDGREQSPQSDKIHSAPNVSDATASNMAQINAAASQGEAAASMQSTEEAMHALISTAAYAGPSKSAKEPTVAGAVRVKNTTTRTASSSSTLKASTRKESSSSTLKASTQKKSSSAPADTSAGEHAQQRSSGLLSELDEHLTANVRSTSDSHPQEDQDTSSEEDEEEAVDLQQLDGTHDASDIGRKPKRTPDSDEHARSSSVRAKAVGAGEVDQHLSLSRHRKVSTQWPPAQCISPAESFPGGQALTSIIPVPPAQRDDQGRDISVSIDGTSKKMYRSQPAPNRPRAHPQSPRLTPRPRLPNPVAQSQRSKGDVIFDSDPDSSPMKGDSDPPSSSVRASSPSHFLDPV